MTDQEFFNAVFLILSAIIILAIVLNRKELDK